MLDLFSHFAALDVLRARLRRQGLDDGIAEITDAYKAVEANHPYAVLGSVIDHLIAHDTVSDIELAVLGEALYKFDKLKRLIKDFRKARATIEQLARQPGDVNALMRYNQARADLASVAKRYDPLVAELQGFAWKRLRAVQYLVGHPQNADVPVKDWPWRDLLLSRRTGAFTATTLDLARRDGRPEALAFAVGVLASYAGNAIGSPYLTRTVGGPRRSHKLRDRVAAYSTGAWLRHVGPSADLPLDGHPTTTLMGLGAPTVETMPGWLIDLVGQALKETYGDLAALPDLTVAYRKLLHHWDLLHSFQPPSPARPIPDDLDIRIVNSNLSPQDVTWPDTSPPSAGPAPGGGSGSNIFDPGPGMPPWYMPAHDNVEDYIKEGCLDALMGPLFLVRLGFWLGHKIFDKEPKTGQAVGYLTSALTQADYDTVMAGPDILIATKAMHDLDTVFTSFATHCLFVLKVGGLIYPSPQDLWAPEFSQFVAPPPRPASFEWPARPRSWPNLSGTFPLVSATENPSTPADFADGEKPCAFLTGGSTPAPSVLRDGYDILADELTNRPGSVVRTTNTNLDGDRGPGSVCWQLAAGTSMSDDPVDVAALGYADI